MQHARHIPVIAEGQHLAAVDLGSNSFHMVVARMEHGAPRTLDRIKEMVRLAEGLDKQGKLNNDVRERALACLRRFGQRLETIPAPLVRVVGTNALRQMHPKRKFLDQAEAALGHPIDIIGGREEARLIWWGVAHGIAQTVPHRLVIDIGGGSTEFVIGNRSGPRLTESLPFGCVKVTQQFFPDGEISEEQWVQAVRFVEQEVRVIRKSCQNLGWQEVIGSSGTARAVCRVAEGLGLTDHAVTFAHLEVIRDAILETGHVKALQFPGLSERRRPVFAGGVAALLGCFKSLGITQFQDSDLALREGVLEDLIGRTQTGDPRQQSIRALMQIYGVDTEQASRVLALVEHFVEQCAADCQLSEAAIRLLGFAAQVHELGLTISHEQYQRHGGYVIRHSDMMGFSRLEQDVLSILISCQRSSISRKLIKHVPDRLYETVLNLLTIFRLTVLWMRDRQSARLPNLRKENGVFNLTVPNDTEQQNPLTWADLHQEVQNLENVGVSLRIDVAQ